MTELLISLTGTVAIEPADGDAVSVTAPRVRLALAYLALERRPVASDELADLFWPDELPHTWDTAVRMVVSRLRRALQPLAASGVSIRSAFGCYALDLPAHAEIDIVRAREDAAAAQAALRVGHYRTASALARRAGAVVSSAFLPGETREWAERHRRAMAVLHTRVLVTLSSACAGMGCPDEAVAAAARAVQIDPLRESSYRALMAAHAANRDVAAALTAYEACREALANELGADPSPETVAQHVALLRGRPAGCKIRHNPRCTRRDRSALVPSTPPARTARYGAVTRPA